MGRKFLSPLDLSGQPITSLSTGYRSTTDPLYPWRRWYAKRHATQVGIVCIGDSILFGDGDTIATPPASDQFQSTIQLQLQAILNHATPFSRQSAETLQPGAYRPGNAGGYFVRMANYYYDGNAPTPFFTAAGSTSASLFGLGGATTQMASGTILSHTAQSATGFAWFYEDGVSNVGMPAVSIYAGDYSATRTGILVNNSAQTANTGKAQYATTVNLTNTSARGKWTFEWSVASGTPRVSGLYVLDGDEFSGVKILNNCLGGSVSADWASTGTRGVSQTNGIAAWTPIVSNGLVILYIGANDYSNGVNPSTYQTNLATIISNYRTALGVSNIPVLLVSHFARFDVTSPAFPWSQYQAAMKAVAAAGTNVDYLDLSPYFPASQAADTDGDLIDTTGVHFTRQGQGVAAQVIADKLMSGQVF